MPLPFQSGIDLVGNEAWNLRIQNLGTAPATTDEGRIYYDTALHAFRVRSNAGWLSWVDGVARTTWDANSLVKADTDDTPVVLAVASDTIVGRVTGVNGGVISALSAPQIRTFLGSLDQFTAPAADWSVNSHKITNLLTPTVATDAATKAYVDAAISGLDIKASVRAASTGNLTLSGPGATIDGVTMVAGDRVLLLAQTTPSQNGVYVWNGAAVPMTRATDADTSAKVTAGLFVFVAEGTVNSDRGYVLTTNDAIVLDTTNLTFTQFSGSGSVVGTTNRITVTGNQVDVSASYAGQSTITVTGTIATGTWQATPVGLAYGGTGAATAPLARAALQAMGRYTTTLGNGSLTSFTVTHSMGTLAVVVELYDSTTKQTVYADVTRVDANSITVGGFLTAPATGAITVVVLG